MSHSRGDFHRSSSSSVGELATAANRPRSCAGVVWILRQNHALIAVIATLFLAYPYPNIGAVIYKAASEELVAALFFLVGCTVELERLRQGACALHVHLLIQTYNLLVMPLLYYATVHRTHWAQTAGILTHELAIGSMAALCMPTTANTCVLFTRQASGDDSVAVFNATVGNVIGLFVAPVMAHYLIGGDASEKVSMMALVNLLCETVLPFALGAALQCVLLCSARSWLNFAKRFAGRTLNLLMIILFYFIWCTCLQHGSHGLAAPQLASMIAWIALVHIIFFCGAWMLGKFFDIERRIALVCTAPQKTEGMAVAILGIIFKGDPNLGVYLLPAVAYHSVQMILAASLLGYFRRLVERDHNEKQLSDTKDGLAHAAGAMISSP